MADELYKGSVLVTADIRIPKASAVDQHLSNELSEKLGCSGDRIVVRKRLFSLSDVSAWRDKARAAIIKRGTIWIEGEGPRPNTYLVSGKNIHSMVDELSDYREGFFTAAKQMVDSYDNIVETAKRELGIAYNAVEMPTKHSFANSFNWEVEVATVGGSPSSKDNVRLSEPLKYTSARVLENTRRLCDALTADMTASLLSWVGLLESDLDNLHSYMNNDGEFVQPLNAIYGAQAMAAWLSNMNAMDERIGKIGDDMRYLANNVPENLEDKEKLLPWVSAIENVVSAVNRLSR